MNSKSTYLTLFLFSLAMGFLEALVVVYIRELYYPDGFQFPLKLLTPRLTGIELVRELCTLVMLGTIAVIAGKSFIRRFSAFLFSFGVWDIFYYAGLKLFLGWPESWFTWDILFLIPVVWVGPVLAPVICSVMMILLAILFEWLSTNKQFSRLNRLEWAFLLSGALVVYISFTLDISLLILKNGYLPHLLTVASDPGFIKSFSEYVPVIFHWEIFITGLILIIGSAILLFRRSQK